MKLRPQSNCDPDQKHGVSGWELAESSSLLAMIPSFSELSIFQVASESGKNRISSFDYLTTVDFIVDAQRIAGTLNEYYRDMLMGGEIFSRPCFFLVPEIEVRIPQELMQRMVPSCTEEIATLVFNSHFLMHGMAEKMLTSVDGAVWAGNYLIRDRLTNTELDFSQAIPTKKSAIVPHQYLETNLGLIAEAESDEAKGELGEYENICEFLEGCIAKTSSPVSSIGTELVTINLSFLMHGDGKNKGGSQVEFSFENGEAILKIPHQIIEYKAQRYLIENESDGTVDGGKPLKLETCRSNKVQLVASPPCDEFKGVDPLVDINATWEIGDDGAIIFSTLTNGQGEKVIRIQPKRTGFSLMQQFFILLLTKHKTGITYIQAVRELYPGDFPKIKKDAVLAGRIYKRLQSLRHQLRSVLNEAGVCPEILPVFWPNKSYSSHAGLQVASLFKIDDSPHSTIRGTVPFDDNRDYST